MKGAIQSGLPPLALLFADPTRKDVWTSWDLKLIQAFYINEAFEIDGHPIHIEESPDIIWTAKKRKLRSAEVVEIEQERMSKSKSKNHGVKVVAIPTLRPGAKWPTREEWAKRQTREDPGDDKLKKVAAEQEERARQKLIEMGIEPHD